MTPRVEKAETRTLDPAARVPRASILRSVLLVPTIISLVWIVLARSRANGRDDPLAPTTTVGRLALASLALMIVVVVANAAVVATVPAGFVMFAVGAFARWGRHDRGVLLVVPVVFGLTVLFLPIFFE